MANFEGATIRKHHLFPSARRERLYYESLAINCPAKECHGYLERIKGKTLLRCVVCRTQYVLAKVKSGGH